MTESSDGTLVGRRVVVGVSGSIAAYKAAVLVRQLAAAGAIVDVAMTPAATQFVTPLTFASLTHRPVVTDVMALDPDQHIAHVELAEAADAIVLAPATANLLGELAARSGQGLRHHLGEAQPGQLRHEAGDLAPPADPHAVPTHRSSLRAHHPPARATMREMETSP